MENRKITFKRPLLAAAAAIAIGIAPGAMAFENEVWISPIGPAVTNASGTNIIGTPTYPFRCPDGPSLNTVLSAVLTNGMTIHLMAGKFTVSNYITMKPGWNLIGAGIDNTVLTLQANTGVSPQMYVIGGQPAYVPQTDGVSISDLTVDCNMQNQSGYTGWIGTVGINGSNTRISRVKGIDWGSTSGEGFNIVLAPGSATTVSNRVIEGCVVTQPAPTMIGGRQWGPVIFSDHSPTLGNRDSVIKDNLVFGVFCGLGTPGSPGDFGALGGVGWIAHNRVIDIVGGEAIYADTAPMRDVVIEDNVFDNVSAGIYYNLGTTNSTNILIKNNVIRPAENGIGINYYTGEYSGSNVSAKNLMIIGNTIYPSATATDVTALALDTYISAVVMNNILQGGGNGSDFFVNLPNDPLSIPGLQLNTWSGNVNMAGTQLVMGGGDVTYQPGSEDTIRFLPSTNGWYRVSTGYVFQAAAIYVSTGESPNFRYNANWTDTEFWFRVNTFITNSAAIGETGLTRRGSQFYASAGPVTAARIVSDYPNSLNVYLDLYIPDVGRTIPNIPIVVTARGLQRGRMYTSPARITTTPAVYQQINF